MIGAIGDLGQAVPVPKGIAGFPPTSTWSVRWVLLQCPGDCRHVGHADIVREFIDGASAFPLMAAAEGGPRPVAEAVARRRTRLLTRPRFARLLV